MKHFLLTKTLFSSQGGGVAMKRVKLYLRVQVLPSSDRRDSVWHIHLWVLVAAETQKSAQSALLQPFDTIKKLLML